MDQFDQLPLECDLRPAYYDDFQCLMEDCRFNCCRGGWRITFSKKDYLTVKRQTGSPELNTRLNHCLRRIRSGKLGEAYYAELHLDENGKCPLHNENGLCALQMEKGAEVLPTVCRMFPRVEEGHFSGYLERSLSPACEGVLKLLWNLPEGVDFRSDPQPEPLAAAIPVKYRGSLLYEFQDIRSQCIDFLQNRWITLPQRIMLMGDALRKLMAGETDIKRWSMDANLMLNRAAKDGMSLLANREEMLPQYLISCLRVLYTLPCTNDSFKNSRQELLNALEFEQIGARANISVEAYKQARTRYEECFRGRDYFLENLMVSVFFQLRMPRLDSAENIWNSYVDFCNMYAFYRFLSVMSCRKGAAGDIDELFRLIVFGSRGLIHNTGYHNAVLNTLFQGGNPTTAQVAVLLSG